MTAWIAVVVVGAALAAGLVANRWVRPSADSETKGLKLEALVGPTMTLAVLLLAFTLVTVFGSFQRASQSAVDEAGTVDFLFELGQYTPDGIGTDLQAAVACYAAAVAGPEWEAMAHGRTAPQVSQWTAAIRASIEELTGSETPSSVQSAVLTADKERAEARSQRLTETRPSVPTLLFVLLVGAASIGVFALATFTLPDVARWVQVGVLALLAVLLASFIGVIWDMDRPYDGVVTVEATDMRRVAADLREDFAEDRPEASLPCDERGEAAAG